MPRLRGPRIPQPGPLPPAAQSWLWRVAVFFVAVAVLTLPIAWSVRFSAQSGGWWERGFNAGDVEARTGLARAEIDRATGELRAYFQSGERFVAISVTNAAGAEEPLFTEREVLHLVDVKRLLGRTYDAGWAALGFLVTFPALLCYVRRRGAARALARTGIVAGLTSAATVVVLGVIAISGFDEAFRQFHLLFFSNDLWQLSSQDRLIQLFPQRFFFETTLLIGSVTLAFGAALAGGGWCYLRRAARSSQPDGSLLGGERERLKLG